MAEPSVKVERRPLVCVWEITNACNLRCVHCEGSAGKRHRAELDRNEALALCDALGALGCLRCNLSGGEPLLRPDWPDLARRLADQGIDVHLVTNGSLLDAEAVARAEEAGVVGVAVSLDGLRPTHDRIRPPASRRARSSYDDTLAALGRLRRSRMKTGVITHINRWNLGELAELHELLAGLGLDVWQVQLCIPAGRVRELGEPYLIRPEQLEEVYAFLLRAMDDGRVPVRVTDTIGYYTELEPVIRCRYSEGSLPFWTGCHAGLQVVGIESNGDVKGCPCMPAEFVAGNLRQRSLEDIWRDEEGFAYNTRWREEELTGFCRGCAYRRLCRAGCTTFAYALTGTIYDNPYCLHRVRTTRGEPSA
jgi:radical SAM protein with 4Fe4S-binding SPASM domain